MAPPPKLRHLTAASDASSDTDSAAESPPDGLLDAALAMADPAVPIGLSLNRIVNSTPLWIDRERLFDRAMRFSAALADAVVLARNLHGWPLPADLTVKVLSMLDTRTVLSQPQQVNCSGKYWGISNSEASELEILIENCPLLSSLTIRCIGIEDDLLSVLLKGAHGLKSLDLLCSHIFSGDFLSSIEVSPVLQGRPDVQLIVDYPLEIYFDDCMSPPSPRSHRAVYSAWLDSIFKKNVAAS